MWFSPAERAARRARLASSRRPEDFCEAAARGGGAEGRRGCGPGRRVPAPPGRPGADSPGPARPPGHRQFTARGCGGPRGHRNTMLGPPADATAQTLSPGQRPSRGPGPPRAGTQDSGRASGPLRSANRGAGGGSRATQRRARDGGCSAPAPTDPPRPGALGEVGLPPPQFYHRLRPQAPRPAERGVAPVPAAASRGGPAPPLPLPSSSVRRAHPGSRLSGRRPSFPSRSRRSQRPGVPGECLGGGGVPRERSGGPQRAPEPPQRPRWGMRAPGGHAARSARQPPPAPRGRGCPNSPQHHQLPVFHRLLVGGAVLLLAGGKHGAPLGRRRRLLRRDPRRVRAAATIPSREGGERAGEGHGGEGGAGRPVPRLLRRGCAAAPLGSRELRESRPPRARLGNKWDRAAGGPARAERRRRRRRNPAGGRKGTSEGGRAGAAAGEGRGQDRGAAPPRGQVGAAPPPAGNRHPRPARRSRPRCVGPPAPTLRLPPPGPAADRPPCYVNIE